MSRWKWVVVGLAVVGLVLGGGALALRAFRDDPGAKSIDAAVDDFRGGTTSTPSESRQPAVGVYSATGEGHGSLSVPPLSQDDGSPLPVTVTAGEAGCWTLRVDYNTAHWQTWDFCADSPTSLVEHGGQTFQRWVVGPTTIDNLSTFTCDPPAFAMAIDLTPGTSWDASCSGTNTQAAGTTTSAGPYTYVGAEDIRIGTSTITVQRYHQARTLSGAQVGEESAELWIEPATGLPVRTERTLDVRSGSPIGDITYREQGWWQLDALTPRT